MKLAMVMSMIGIAGMMSEFVLGGQEARIVVRADQPGPRISRYMAGACIEDVNHEIYGGLYSQMIFGESFQEPPAVSPLKGFTGFGGTWEMQGQELHFRGQPGDKLVSDSTPFADGEAGVDVFLPSRDSTNVGFIVRVDRPGPGTDNFDGYEVALNAAAQVVRLGRHRHDWQLIKDTPCEVPVAQWIALSVILHGPTIAVLVNGKEILRHDDGELALKEGTVGLRPFQSDAKYRKLWVKTGDVRREFPFEREEKDEQRVSRMWRLVRRGEIDGSLDILSGRPFTGKQYQRMTFHSGQGELGVDNQGLNRWGMYFVQGRPYEGELYVRSQKPTTFFVALESNGGARVYAEQSLQVNTDSWQLLTFTLVPDATDKKGQFAIKLKEAGSVDLGYVFLQPGEWGRYKGLPVRRDVAEALIDQGITILRYGGSMILADEYRWKKMIGPRAQRPPYNGTWYPYATHGWGILDFLNFCEAAGLLGIPDLNIDESPADLADFIEYVNGPAESEWGRRRIQDGHPKPYNLKYIQLGNEPDFTTAYVAKVKPAVEAVWARDSSIIVIVSDSNFDQPVTAARNPELFAAHRDLLALAKARNRELWFDTHLGADLPVQVNADRIVSPFLEALAQSGPGVRTRVAICELNANSHHVGRALANAMIISEMERLGEDRIPLVTSANCLQPDGQNDNGWNQGLLFLNPSQVWLQPPGYVSRMIARHYQPVSVPIRVVNNDQVKAAAARSEDGKVLVLRVVNINNQPRSAIIELDGFTPVKATAAIEELSGPMNATNTADAPNRIVPQSNNWLHKFAQGRTTRVFPPHSFTVMQFE